MPKGKRLDRDGYFRRVESFFWWEGLTLGYCFDAPEYGSMTALSMFKRLQRPAVPQACNCGQDILLNVEWDA